MHRRCVLTNETPCGRRSPAGFVSLRELCVLVALIAGMAYGFDRLQRGIEHARPRDFDSLPTVHHLMVDDATRALWVICRHDGIARYSLPDLEKLDFVPLEQGLSNAALSPFSPQPVFASSNLEGLIEIHVDGRRMVEVFSAPTPQHRGALPHGAVAISRDGRVIVAATSDDALHRWRRDEEELQYDRQKPGVILERIELHPAGRLLAVLSDRTHVGVWNLDERAWQCAWELEHPFCSGLAWSPDGSQLASIGCDAHVCLWDARRGELLWKQAGDGLDPAGVAFSPCGHWLATGGFDKRVRLWDARRGTLVWERPGHARAPRVFAWSGDSRTLYSSGLDGCIRTWDVPAATP